MANSICPGPARVHPAAPVSSAGLPARHVARAAIFAGMMILPLAPVWGGESHPLILNPAAGSATSTQPCPGARRCRSVEPNLALLHPGSLAAGDRLTLNLFADAVYLATVVAVETDLNGVTRFTARMDGGLGDLLVSGDQGRMLADISMPRRGWRYTVRYSPAIRWARTLFVGSFGRARAYR